MEDIRSTLERLMAAYEAAGGPASFDPADEDELDELRAMVAPLRLPVEIEHLWRRFQEDGPPFILDMLPLGTVRLAIDAAPHSLQSWALLLIGAGGSRQRFLELHDADGMGGGSIWIVEESEPEMREVAPSLAALIAATAIAWERGIARLREDYPFPWTAWDEEAWERLKAEVLPAGRVAGARPAGWLPRWLAVEGMTASDVLPHGATTSIGDLLAPKKAWAETETIRGRITSVVSGAAVAARVDDGTGELRVYVPEDADRFMLLTWKMDFELDVRPFPAGEGALPPFDAGAFDALAIAVRDA